MAGTPPPRVPCPEDAGHGGRAPEAIWPPPSEGCCFGGVPRDGGLELLALALSSAAGGRRGDPAAGDSRVPLFRSHGFPGRRLRQLRRLSPGLLGAAPTSRRGKLRQAVGPEAGGSEGSAEGRFPCGCPAESAGAGVGPRSRSARPRITEGKALRALTEPGRSSPGRLRNVGMPRGAPRGREAGERLPGGR